MAYEAGTTTLAYKSLAGIQPDYISTTKYNNLESKTLTLMKKFRGKCFKIWQIFGWKFYRY